MVLIAECYTGYIEAMYQTLVKRDSNIRILVLQDDGFLPDHVDSLFGHFVEEQNKEKHEKMELYHAFLPLPEFWQIRVDVQKGRSGVWDTGHRKGSIYYRSPEDKRIVSHIEWETEEGWIYKRDFYNQYGLKYTTEFLDEDGEINSKVFYSEVNQEVIIEQEQNHIITYREKGKIKGYFDSYRMFLEYYLKKTGENGKRIYCIQDENDFYKLKNEEKIENQDEIYVYKNTTVYNNVQGVKDENHVVFYPIKDEKKNCGGKDFFILTYSDQIENIELLVSRITEANFHIAAKTLVSEKLMQLERFSNVKIYPLITPEKMKSLWDKCSFYLDINYSDEVDNAVSVASQENLLILACDTTIHNRDLILEECIFSKADCEKMVQELRTLMNHPAEMADMLKKQQEKRNRMWDEVQVKLFGD